MSGDRVATGVESHGEAGVGGEIVVQRANAAAVEHQCITADGNGVSGPVRIAAGICGPGIVHVTDPRKAGREHALFKSFR